MGGNLRAMCSLLGAERPTIPFFRRRGDFLMENDREKKKGRKKGEGEKRKGDERGERKRKDEGKERKNWNLMNRENVDSYILYTIYIYIYLFIQPGIRGLISLSSSESSPLRASSSSAVLLFHTGS